MKRHLLAFLVGTAALVAVGAAVALLFYHTGVAMVLSGAVVAYGLGRVLLDNPYDPL